MKCLEVLVAVTLLSVLSGCQFGQGESPASEPVLVNMPVDKPARPSKPGAVVGAPTAIAGDPVSSPSKTTAAAAPPPGLQPFVTVPSPASMGSFPSGNMSRVNSLKPDKIVTGYYKNADGMSIGIEAVCQITEDTIICRKPGGARDKNLEAKLDKIMQSDQNTYFSGISFRYKKKNRFILFKKEYPMQRNAPIAYASIAQIGEETTSMNGSYINMSSLSQPLNPEGPRFEYEMRSVAVPISQKTVNVYVNSTVPVPIQGELKLSKGSALTNGKLSIAYVSQAPANGRMFGPDVKVWEIVFKTNKPDARMQFALSPIMKGSDAGYGMVDQNGDVVKAGIYSDGEAGQGRRPRISTRSAMAMPVLTSPTEIKVRTNVNPKHLTGFRVTAFRNQIIQIKNIALD